uniref:Microfibril associated protein 2 n=1 Tax=Pundamilia nyererei TaxID=303518 RepID=A0A3B4FP57_9CICH
MSTVVLFSQPQYQDPYIFNGKLIKGILAYIVPAQHRFTSALSTSVLNSSLSSAVSPTLEEFALPPSLYPEFLTEPTEPGPLDCREEQYLCTRLYSVHKPCKQCLNSLCFYSLRRVYVVNKEVCVRTVCAHEELLRADLCRDQFSRCGVAALSGQCASLGGNCGKSCGSC